MKAIIFDFDGVIVDSEPLHYAAFARIAGEFGLDLDYPTYLKEYIGFDDRDAIARILEVTGQSLDDQSRQDLIMRKADIFAELATQHTSPLPGAVELIRGAAERLPIAIASGAIQRDIDIILAHIAEGSLRELFQTIVTADDVAKSKPDPATYLIAAERLGVSPGDCLAIEDTVTGLISAQDAGMKTLAVGTSYPLNVLRDYSDRTVLSLADVDMDRLLAWF